MIDDIQYLINKIEKAEARIKHCEEYIEAITAYVQSFIQKNAEFKEEIEKLKLKS